MGMMSQVYVFIHLAKVSISLSPLVLRLPTEVSKFSVRKISFSILNSIYFYNMFSLGFTYFYVYWCFAYMHFMYHMNTWCPQSQGNTIRCSGTRVADSCNLSGGCWELNPGPLEKQPVLNHRAFSPAPYVSVLRGVHSNNEACKYFSLTTSWGGMGDLSPCSLVSLCPLFLRLFLWNEAPITFHSSHCGRIKCSITHWFGCTRKCTINRCKHSEVPVGGPV